MASELVIHGNLCKSRLISGTEYIKDNVIIIVIKICSVILDLQLYTTVHSFLILTVYRIS